MAASTLSARSIASMRRRLVILAPVETPDEAGGATVTWTPAGAFWARVEWRSGDERWRADRPEQAGRIRVTLRRRSGLAAGLRLADGARVLDIRAVADPDGAGTRLVCLCEEIST